MQKFALPVVLFLLLAAPAMATGPGRAMGPPPGASEESPSGPPTEAFEACEGKAV